MKYGPAGLYHVVNIGFTSLVPHQNWPKLHQYMRASYKAFSRREMGVHIVQVAPEKYLEFALRHGFNSEILKSEPRIIKNMKKIMKMN